MVESYSIDALSAAGVAARLRMTGDEGSASAPRLVPVIFRKSLRVMVMTSLLLFRMVLVTFFGRFFLVGIRGNPLGTSGHHGIAERQRRTGDHADRTGRHSRPSRRYRALDLTHRRVGVRRQVILEFDGVIGFLIPEIRFGAA